MFTRSEIVAFIAREIFCFIGSLFVIAWLIHGFARFFGGAGSALPGIVFGCIAAVIFWHRYFD